MNKFDAEFGHVEILEGTDEVGVSILVIYPGREITIHFHKKTKEYEIIIEGELECNEKILKQGEVMIWEPNQAHGYKNNSDKDTKVLCITQPPYNPEDSFEVDKQ